MGLMLFCTLTILPGIQARAVFAHFMVSNTEGYTVDDWETEIKLAMEAKIDAFALNIATGQSVNTEQVPNAFLAAENLGFHLFFSFDYSGNGAWAKDDVLLYIQEFNSPSVYYQYNSQAFVSTFEGPANAEDWVSIKEETGCFFAPDWSSLGAMEAMEQADGVADALFSWAAWPYGPNDMNTYTDASYIDYLDGKPYMMPVSPWFFTNMPGYDKNWLWRGDDMWFDRWVQALWIVPEFIEIISWNDFGESHYIGPIKAADDPLANYTYTAFDTGLSPYNYVLDMPHDGWRAFLPFVIETYKTNTSTITQEGVTAWYRLNKAGTCGYDGGTTGNTANELQLEYWPYEIVQDKIFFSALLGSTADVSVTVGGTDLGASWTSTPSGDVGIYHGSVSFSGHSGAVIVTITRDGSTVATMDGQSISSGCAASSGVENWNAWVGSAMSSSTISATPTYSLDQVTCIEGWGSGNFLGLCEAACGWGYCPISACLCTKLGPPPSVPSDTGVEGYPIAGEDGSYTGLCSFDCDHGYCPSTACGTVDVPLATPTVSDFTPYTCDGGEGSGDFVDLCAFGCLHGYCPIHGCNCTSTGDLDLYSIVNSSITAGLASGLDDYGLCDFACERDHCYDVCQVGSSYSASDDYSCTDNDTRSWCDSSSPCNYSLPISTMDDLLVAEAYMPDDCVDYYMLTILYNLIDVVVTNYTEIIDNNNYNKTFKFYKEYIEANITTSLDDLMSWEDPVGAGNAYFACTPEINGVNRSQTSCPWYEDAGTFKVYYELTNATGWWSMLEEDYGIEESWVAFGEKELDLRCTADEDKDGCQSLISTSIGIPVKSDDVSITDPRTIIADALPYLDGLQGNILEAQVQILVGSWPGYSDDIVQTISLAVELLLQSVTSMQEVVKIGDEEEEIKKKELMEEILMAVFLIVPFLGEIDAISDTFAGLARILTLIGDVSTAAYTVYSIVEDPESAVALIFETLLLSGERTPDEFDDMATARRKLTDDEITSLGSVFKKTNTDIENLVEDCIRD
ncbi:hypothetical protein BO70DRAFT_393486 [Aspergillus heteromorphus CBS 117.55]|uniref:Alpha-1,3-glucanase/mutanase n=1 Tax=Aspergillus heteromorphus CBS 117.55 TaxID=1448321 RepID=A0A317WRA3_9EURO|nr:uncharacterized protein BO70DRAFT_393486 [Aspergillus heteromorphus CBS 117.55]PWY88966.1 hypothetical protein BO70DRAFT_393486 [Aspergillus heteromorphus CBS 117.55]